MQVMCCLVVSLNSASSSHPHTHTHTHSHCRYQETRRSWERSRTAVGSRWLWLEHRINELNKQICQLDNIMQRRPSRENFVFTPPSSSSPSSSHHAMLPNGTLIEQLHRGNGSLLALGKGRVVNGFNNHAPHLPQLLWTDGILNTRLQVWTFSFASIGNAVISR